MAEKLNESKIMQALDWLYEKSINGLPGMDSAEELASDYLKQEGSIIDKVNSLIRWQNTKAGGSGFLTGLGGIITLPITIPANISSVMYVQMRMVAAIAYMGGHDIRDDQVKSLVYVCLIGSLGVKILKDVGIVIGKNLTKQAIKSISKNTITAINKKVGFRLLTKFGEKGAINLGKLIPIIGGVIGMTIDSIATNTIGNTARNLFIPIEKLEPEKK